MRVIVEAAVDQEEFLKPFLTLRAFTVAALGVLANGSVSTCSHTAGPGSVSYE